MIAKVMRKPETHKLKLNIATILLLIVLILSLLTLFYEYILMNSSDNIYRRRLSSSDAANEESLKSFPPLIFSLSELKQWAWILYLLGMFYSFIGIAIVCDSFFVPTIEVIVDKLNMSDDTAAATWLALGSSTPEFATAMLGTFVAKSDVGFGTIVGSAIFNIFFIIGVCSMFTAGTLRLYWWSFGRDMTFYLCVLSLLGLFFVVNTPLQIDWYESLILFLCYIIFIILMKNNAKIKLWFFKKLLATKIDNFGSKLMDSKNLMDEYGTVGGTAEMTPTSHGSHDHLQNAFNLSTPDNKCDDEEEVKRQVSFLADLSSIKPKKLLKNKYKYLHDGNISETFGTAEFSHQIGTPYTPFTPQTNISHHDAAPPPHTGGHIHEHSNTVPTVKTIDTPISKNNQNHHHQNNNTPFTPQTTTTRAIHRGGVRSQLISHGTTISVYSYMSRKGKGFMFQVTKQNEELTKSLDSGNKPVDLSIPKGKWNRLFFLFRAPLLYLIAFTLIDVKKEKSQKYWFLSFIGCMLWLGSLTYLMVWWAVCVGYAWGIPQEIMGLIFLAGGTSLPELLSCIIIIKKSKAHMAMSTSIGSNIFDVVFNLPVPWLIYSLVVQPKDKMYYAVSSDGLFISILVLFIMMGLLFVLIFVNKWILTHCMGFTLLFLYGAFIFQDLARFYWIDISL